MAGLKIHYDGWVKLPATLLRALGDTIEVEPREGGLELRARIGKSADAPGPEAADPAPAEDLPDQPRASRRGRAAGGPPSSVAPPPTLRAAGRRPPAKPTT